MDANSLWTAAERSDAIECCDAAFNEKEGVIVQSVADVRKADRTVAALIEALEYARTCVYRGSANADSDCLWCANGAALLDSLR